MAFPDIPTVAGGRILFTLNTAGGASGVKTFPNLSSLTKNSGDLLLAIAVIYDGNSNDAEFSSWGASFTEFGDFATTGTISIGCAYKFSTGSETGTFTVTSADTSTNDSVMILMSVANAHSSSPPEAGGYTFGVNDNADPGPLSPSWGAEDTLWIAVAGCGETSTAGSFTGLASEPIGLTGYAESGITADVVGGMEAAVAFSQTNTDGLVVGPWTNDTSNSRVAACMVAVRPAAAAFVPRNSASNHQNPALV